MRDKCMFCGDWHKATEMDEFWRCDNCRRSISNGGGTRAELMERYKDLKRNPTPRPPTRTLELVTIVEVEARNIDMAQEILGKHGFVTNYLLTGTGWVNFSRHFVRRTG